MGTLVLPPAGTIYIDANVLIYSVQQHPVYFSVLLPLWQAQQAGRHVITSELTRMEALILPMRLHDSALIASYRQLFQQQTVDLLPILPGTLEEAARLRASIAGLKTPDAIHAAAALLHGCTLFLTNDAGFKRVPNLPVNMLDDVIASP